ncbi:MAG: phosphate acyltransferase PlsX [Lachnospiraceae bacterium]|nr:phosphate acyltransferase PlsX [Lachnospiraceae bacterium]
MESMIVAVDVMGGDNAPVEPIKGAIEALKQNDNLVIHLVGTESVIREVLDTIPDANTYKNRYSIVATTEVIATAESPTVAIAKKKDSSLVVAMKEVKTKDAQAMVSAGNSGAILVGGQVLVGRLPGVKRAPLAPLIPTEKGPALLIDCGANLDARPELLVQFAEMGSIYMEKVMKVDHPRVAIVNVGAEEEKGNKLVKETFPLLKALDDINFIGSIEARDIPSGYADVIVTEAFVGNVILKMYEGVGKTFFKLLKEAFTANLKSKLGAGLALPVLKEKLKDFDVTRYGGAPMLGLNGLVVKTHGSATAKEFTTSILQCITFRDQNIKELIRENLSKGEN